MHTDLIEKMIARRLRTLAEESIDAPYEWAEFERRRLARPTGSRRDGRNRPAATATATAAAAVAAVVVLAITVINLGRKHTPALVPVDTASHVSDRAEQPATSDQAHTRAIEGWLAGLPHDPAVVRVGAHAAVTSLQDQIAALDDLMSAERVAGANQSRLDALERRRVQLVSSLAQLQYAEMLASANL